MKDVEWLRTMAGNRRQIAYSYEQTARPMADEHYASAELFDRAADALDLVERGRGAEALRIQSEPFMGGEALFRVVSHQAVRPTEAEPNVRHAFAARLIATALKLLE